MSSGLSQLQTGLTPLKVMKNVFCFEVFTDWQSHNNPSNSRRMQRMSEAGKEEHFVEQKCVFCDRNDSEH